MHTVSARESVISEGNVAFLHLQHNQGEKRIELRQGQREPETTTERASC